MTDVTTAHTPIDTFLDALAAGESTPGGGAAAALTGSQAAALLSMVLNFTIGRKKYAAVEAEMGRLVLRTETMRATLLALADKDAQAFGAVAACYGMPRSSAAEKVARTAALQEALKGATEVPFAIAALCAELLEMACPIAEKGNSNVVSDAATAAHLAHAALHSALLNVNINLKYLKDDVYVTEWRGKVEALEAAAESAYTMARASCTKTLGVAI